jgi:hypothetical protein
MGRGFQTVQGRVASRAERGAAGLTAEGLDLLSPTLLAISHQRMEVRLGDPAVRATLGWDRRNFACLCVWELLAGF